MRVPFAPPARIKIVFKVRITGNRLLRAERRPSKIGVQHHPRGIDHPPQRRPRQGAKGLHHLSFNSRFGGAVPCPDTRPPRLQDAPDFLHHQRSRIPCQYGIQSREDLMHRRQTPQLPGLWHEFIVLRRLPSVH